MAQFEVKLKITRSSSTVSILKDLNVVADSEKQAAEVAKLQWANIYINKESPVGEFKSLKLAKNHLKGIKIELHSVNFA